MILQVGVDLRRKRQPFRTVAGVFGAGTRLRPSRKIEVGLSGFTIPTTSGVARSREAIRTRYRRYRDNMLGFEYHRGCERRNLSGSGRAVLFAGEGYGF